MHFDIRFTGETAPEDTSIAIGEVRLGPTETETFEAVTGFWTPADYQRQWAMALRRTAEGAAISCLLTSVTDPTSANYLESWPVYRIGPEVYLQNHFLFLAELRDFDINAPWACLGERRIIDEDQQRISEWRFDVDDITDWLAKQQEAGHE